MIGSAPTESTELCECAPKRNCCGGAPVGMAAVHVCAVSDHVVSTPAPQPQTSQSSVASTSAHAHQPQLSPGGRRMAALPVERTSQAEPSRAVLRASHDLACVGPRGHAVQVAVVPREGASEQACAEIPRVRVAVPGGGEEQARLGVEGERVALGERADRAAQAGRSRVLQPERRRRRTAARARLKGPRPARNVCIAPCDEELLPLDSHKLQRVDRVAVRGKRGAHGRVRAGGGAQQHLLDVPDVHVP
eukprot:CAMPEP_0180045004 /NCGR_PEP_ID=MMETSP0984-20121128/36222_1 /TAXON_ID=483367 /ORGANISM="non described non described, Strain CCMP 2436" /LENGTH=247 /DNA_ID=CAMNT_0021973203 /DNA_START=353 /DNA_END=1097 /DNA_ORIENTATION=-